jgi:hypothetical protein
MQTEHLINLLLLGGISGVAGQALRIIVGLKKLNYNNSVAVTTGAAQQDFSWGRMLISVLMGFIIGIVGMLIKYWVADNNDVNVGPELIVAITAVGYSGVDFLENIFNTYLPKHLGNNAFFTHQAKKQTTL